VKKDQRKQQRAEEKEKAQKVSICGVSLWACDVAD
jgi:hypothetical protein